MAASPRRVKMALVAETKVSGLGGGRRPGNIGLALLMAAAPQLVLMGRGENAIT